jgi:LAS superfamily LD-carboxypeptidase LdcB
MARALDADERIPFDCATTAPVSRAPGPRHVGAVTTAALAAAALGCMTSDPHVPVFPVEAPIVWVDPARCLPSCTHPDDRNLVLVDGAARPTPAGQFRVRADVAPALRAMFEAAAASWGALAISSAYRTHAEQAALWDAFVASEPGRAARPGHSEHEAGLAVDLGFESESGVAWTADNAWQFGFVLSYPQYAQKATGFRYEPWHFRFIGSVLAAELHARAPLTLEELFASTPGLGVSGDCQDCTLPASRSDCADVTPAGRCDGTVLAWCFDGAAAAVDCGVSGLACEVDAAGSADCADP